MQKIITVLTIFIVAVAIGLFLFIPHQSALRVQDICVSYDSHENETIVSCLVSNSSANLYKQIYVHFRMFDECGTEMNGTVAPLINLHPHETKKTYSSIRGRAESCRLKKVLSEKFKSTGTARSFRWINDRLIIDKGKTEAQFTIDTEDQKQQDYKEILLSIDLPKPFDIACASLHGVPDEYAKVEMFFSPEELSHETVVFLITDRHELEGKIRDLILTGSEYIDRCKFYRLICCPARLDSFSINGEPASFGNNAPEYLYLLDIEAVYKEVDWTSFNRR